MADDTSPGDLDDLVDEMTVDVALKFVEGDLWYTKTVIFWLTMAFICGGTVFYPMPFYTKQPSLICSAVDDPYH